MSERRTTELAEINRTVQVLLNTVSFRVILKVVFRKILCGSLSKQNYMAIHSVLKVCF